MKIVVINGQNHKGSTYHIGKLLTESISGEHEVQEFFLPRDLNHFCLGCYTCIEDGTKCPFYEEKNKIMQAVEAADLLIFTTPNYCMAPSAPMKAFMDLTFTYWISHKPHECMYTKKAVVISTTAGAGAGAAVKPVKTMLSYWGVPVIKTYAIGVQAMNWQGVNLKKKAKIEKDMRRLAGSLTPLHKPKVLLSHRFMFNMMRLMFKGHMGSGETERKYWEDHGWLGKGRPWKKS
ncbi:MAG: NAD(P)H-dependent oxidoreductase [bacterium]|nr:NAD(P)H-dependent oxidoreductase [bacterium]